MSGVECSVYFPLLCLIGKVVLQEESHLAWHANAREVCHALLHLFAHEGLQMPH